MNVSLIWMSVLFSKNTFPTSWKLSFLWRSDSVTPFSTFLEAFLASCFSLKFEHHKLATNQQQAPVLGWQGCPCDTVPGDRVIGERSLRRGWTCCWRAWVLLLLQKNPGMIMSAHQIIVTRMDYEDNNLYWVPNRLRKMRKKRFMVHLESLDRVPSSPVSRHCCHPAKRMFLILWMLIVK